MERFRNCSEAFSSALIRAKEMLILFDALKMMKADPMVCDDALRAAWMQMVSSFDYHNHEVFAIEAAHRHSNSLVAKKIAVPLNILCDPDLESRNQLFDQHYRKSISYKSFVAYEKILEEASCFVEDSAGKIEAAFNTLSGETLTCSQIKSTLNNIWNRRNRIAHEADINPTMAGIELWPIFKEDVLFSIAFVEHLAKSIQETVAFEMQRTNQGA